MRYTNPALTIEQQFALLATRGMTIGDAENAGRVPQAVSFDRLRGDRSPFRQRDASGTPLDVFRQGTTFEHVVSLCEFDRHLRLEVLDAIERQAARKKSSGKKAKGEAVQLALGSAATTEDKGYGDA